MKPLIKLEGIEKFIAQERSRLSHRGLGNFSGRVRGGDRPSGSGKSTLMNPSAVWIDPLPVN